MQNQKLLVKQCALMLQQNGCKVTILRIFSGYGPGEICKGEYASPAFKFMKGISRNEEDINLWFRKSNSGFYIY